MSTLPLKTKERALDLRFKGYSIKEIADKLHIAKSTASVWVRSVKLNHNAIERLKGRNLLSYYKTSLRWEKKRAKEEQEYNNIALETIKKIGKDINHFKIYCALLYWCEGGKTSVSERKIPGTYASS